MWLCPFKAVTEYPAVRSFETAVQMGIFITLFLGLVVVLPLLTKKRTQCSFLTLSITPRAVQSGKPLLSCMKCGACVDARVREAAVWHIKGTEVGASSERARLRTPSSCASRSPTRPRPS
jgi:hypothetical protein